MKSTDSTPEAMFRLLVASVRDYAIFMLDPTGRVTTWNTGAQNIKGYAESEIVGRHFSTFYPQSDIDAGKCELELEVAARVGRFEDEGWRVRKDGTQFWANVVITALRDESGSLVGFAKVTRDLTDRVRAETERAARIAAEQANRAKDEFLAMLGHELRNPLAPIVTALELIRLRGGEGHEKEHEVIERQVSHVMRLVDDLLDVARITRGKAPLEARHLDLRTVVSEALETAARSIEERSHHVEVGVPAEPVVIFADHRRMLQVVTNLLTNAAKYTPPGGRIRVALRVDGAEAVLAVEDTGQGIEADLLPRVFDLFVQAEQSPDRAAGGLGLGLTLVRTLVTLHGGRVTAESAGLGKGSLFTVWLPLGEGAAEAEAPRPRAHTAPAAGTKRVLVVDDNEDARELLAEMLETVGYEVKAVGDGADALALVAQFRPELAILDLGLPVMDGFELARRLGDLPDAPPRLIALSGYGQSSDRERSRAAGFEVHLVKPVDTARLLEVLSSLGGT